METPEMEETLLTLRKVWVLFLAGLYFSCFMNEHYYPGFRTDPLPGEEYFWKLERVLLFALMGVGFMIDLVQMRVEQRKAFHFLFLSLVLGTLSNILGAVQYWVVSGAFKLFDSAP